jgi:curved DNA-binding protein
MALKFKDYYETLGVERGATQDEIKAAYRKLARKLHPDVNKAADAEDRFKEIGEAYEVLSDKDKRAKYDQLGARYRNGQDFTPPNGWQSWSNSEEESSAFSDFFESLFGRGFRTQEAPPGAGEDDFGGFRYSQFRDRPGQDQEVRVSIPLEDAYKGAERNITLRSAVRDAKGHARETERVLRIKIPKGVVSGQRVRLTGQGTSGQGRGPAGDLYMLLDFDPNPLFRAEGRDLYMELQVAPWEAALGARIPLKTPDGEVELSVPPGTSSGAKLRLRGKGIPYPKGETAAHADAGDIYVEVKVVLPKTPSAKERDLWEKLAAISKFRPRK